MKHVWSSIQCLVMSILLSLVVSPLSPVYAERGDAAEQQQLMQKMMEMFNKSGMDPKTQKQMENMMGGMAEKSTKHRAAKLKKAQQKFEAETVGHGTAIVEVEGKRYELTMIKCTITDRSTDHFSMQARQAPGMNKATLSVNGGGRYGSALGFSSNTLAIEEPSNDVTFQLNGKVLEGEGAVGDKGKVSLKFRLTCGAEMVDYAAPSKPNPASSANVLTLEMGKETHTFQAGYCSTKEYRNGNLIVEFEATATGMFRGRPAIVLLSKSHPAGSTQTFQNMDLLLGELTPEQRALPPMRVAKQLRKKVETFSRNENAAVQKKYKGKIAAYQKQFDKEMPALKKKYGKQVPPEKMATLMGPFNKLMDAQGKESDKVNEQVKAMRYPKGRSFGAITVKGQEVHFGGSKLSTQDARRAPEFQDLSEKIELWVTCGKS